MLRTDLLGGSRAVPSQADAGGDPWGDPWGDLPVCFEALACNELLASHFERWNEDDPQLAEFLENYPSLAPASRVETVLSCVTRSREEWAAVIGSFDSSSLGAKERALVERVSQRIGK